ncbi:MAG TPA: putative quinol monooxygenase [Thermomicrobiales bacterium]|nr:putative quinol monooxygenase [Thermomicrobiales bacterium]
MYWQVLQVDVQPGRRAELLQLSKAYVEECIREEPGTRSFTFLLDEQDADRFYAIEQYADRAAHHAHSGGPVMQRQGPTIVPLLAGPPVLLASGDQVDLSG